MKNDETQYAVSTRIPTATYRKMEKLISLTKKTTASLVNDAICEYLEQVYDKNYKPSKSMQIDQFAVNIESK